MLPNSGIRGAPADARSFMETTRGKKRWQQVPPDEAGSYVFCAGAGVGVGVGEAAGVTLTREPGAPCPLSDWRFRSQNKACTKLYSAIFLP